MIINELKNIIIIVNNIEFILRFIRLKNISTYNFLLNLYFKMLVTK